MEAAGSPNGTDCSELKKGKDTNTAEAFAKGQRKWANRINTPNSPGWGWRARRRPRWNLEPLQPARRQCKATPFPCCNRRTVALSWRRVLGQRDKPASQKAFQGTSDKRTIVQSLFLRLPCPKTQSRAYFQVGQTQEHGLRLPKSQETAMVTRRWNVHSFGEYLLQRPQWGWGGVLSKPLDMNVAQVQMHHPEIGGCAWTRSSEQMPVLKDILPRP